MVPDTVFVYKQYRDDVCYGEERIDVFEDREDALFCLKEDFCRAFEIDPALGWEKIKAYMQDEYATDENDMIEPDYCSIAFDGDTAFWIVEEHPVKKVKKTTEKIIVERKKDD